MSELKKIDQTEFGEYGNCRSACFAMMLGLDINKVPNFEHGREFISLKAFQERINGWLGEQGISTWFYDIWDGWKDYIHPKQYFMAIIPSNLGKDYKHCVVYKGTKLFYDPLPKNKTPETIEQICLFIPLRLK